MQGWEISPDRIKIYEKMMENDSIGDPIITSKCTFEGRDVFSQKGVLIASTNGYAWRSKSSAGRIVASGVMCGAISAGRAAAVKSKWMRWHDVADIVPKKDRGVIMIVKRRENGALVLNKKGKYKTRMCWLYVKSNKGEPKAHFKQRKRDFFNIMRDIWNRYKGEGDPPISDSFG